LKDAISISTGFVARNSTCIGSDIASIILLERSNYSFPQFIFILRSITGLERNLFSF
jgi:hypothetical protein